MARSLPSKWPLIWPHAEAMQVYVIFYRGKSPLENASPIIRPARSPRWSRPWSPWHTPAVGVGGGAGGGGEKIPVHGGGDGAFVHLRGRWGWIHMGKPHTGTCVVIRVVVSDFQGGFTSIWIRPQMIILYVLGLGGLCANFKTFIFFADSWGWRLLWPVTVTCAQFGPCVAIRWKLRTGLNRFHEKCGDGKTQTVLHKLNLERVHKLRFHQITLTLN